MHYTARILGSFMIALGIVAIVAECEKDTTRMCVEAGVISGCGAVIEHTERQ